MRNTVVIRTVAFDLRNLTNYPGQYYSDRHANPNWELARPAPSMLSDTRPAFFFEASTFMMTLNIEGGPAGQAPVNLKIYLNNIDRAWPPHALRDGLLWCGQDSPKRNKQQHLLATRLEKQSARKLYPLACSVQARGA